MSVVGESYLSVTQTTGWIAEWTGNAEHCHKPIRELNILPSAATELVVDYLKKSDIYGLAELERAYGKGELEACLGKVGPELPLPQNIDQILQTDLTVLFQDKMTASDFHKIFGTLKKATEVFSLYFKPSKITPKICEQLGEKHQMQIDWFLGAYNEYAQDAESSNCWVLFSNRLTNFVGKECCNKKEELQKYIPMEYHASSVADTIFCVLTKFACDKFFIVGERQWILTYQCAPGASCSPLPLVVGNFTPSYDKMNMLRVASVVGNFITYYTGMERMVTFAVQFSGVFSLRKFYHS